MSKDRTSHAGNGPQGYPQQRYHSLDQDWLKWREQRLLARLLTLCQLANRTVLDVPCGYSRFAPLYARLGITAVGADMSYDMAHLAAATHKRHSGEGWLCADILALPFPDSMFDSAPRIRLLHHRLSDAERQRILAELARVSRRFVIISFYQPTLLHALARHWRGARGRLAMMTVFRSAGAGACQRAAGAARAGSPAFLSRADLRGVEQNPSSPMPTFSRQRGRG